MAVANVSLLAFNRGIISRLALARTDIARVALSAEDMVNWMPRVLGPMSLRPGWQYLGSSASEASARHLPFVFSTDDTAIIELTNGALRVWVDDALVTRASVSTAVTNGTFDANVGSWTDVDEAGGVSQWAAGGYMQLTGNGTAAAIRRQQVTVAAGDQNKDHGLRIVINRGPVLLRVGSSAGADDYIREATLETGTHSLHISPGGDLYIQLFSRLARSVYVDSCTIEAAGVMSVTAPWLAADLNNIRVDQSADVVFVACVGYQQRRIERRAEQSWSVVLYKADDGPFEDENLGPITITPSGLTGNITLTASSALFRSTHVGAIWRVTSSGQRVTAAVTAENQFTSTIRVTGVGAQRIFTIIRAGTWVATVTLQRSLEAPGTWEDVTTYTTNATITFDDALDNQIAYYRIGVKTGGFTSSTPTCDLELRYALGSIDGVTRITAFTSTTLVAAEVLTSLGDTVATSNWAEGSWSDSLGWPTAVALHEGRLWWAGQDAVWGSVSDAFDSFDQATEGDSGPIIRSIGSGPVDTINWIMSLQRLILGAEGAEFACKSSSFDEPLTPSAFGLRAASTQGSAGVDSVRMDKLGIFVQRSGTRVYQLALNSSELEYGSSDLTILCPEIGEPSIVRLAIQRQPDTRIHAIRSDGVAAVLVFDPAENVMAWCEIETDGSVEDVVVLPGSIEDQVYYHVRRTINGTTKRYLEKWALTSQCAGGTLNRQADAFLPITQAAATTITGLSHLEGKTVVVWAAGKDLGTKVVSGGQITGLSQAVTSAIVGIGYTAQWRSPKLAFAAQMGTALTQPKRLTHLGVILADTHAQGLQYGQDFDTLDDLPLIEGGAPIDVDSVHLAYDEAAFEFPGSWSTDARLCLQAAAPRPCTVLAAIISVETNERR